MPPADTTNHDDRRPEPVDRLLLTPEQAAVALNIGRTTVYALLRTGRLPSVRIGASRRIPTHAIEDLVAELTGLQHTPASTPRRVTPAGHDESGAHRREPPPRRRHRRPTDGAQLTFCLDTPFEKSEERR